MDPTVHTPSAISWDLAWQQHTMALDRVTDRMHRITAALGTASVPYALVGGQAVALWVATRDPAAVRTTKDVDILIDRSDLPKLRAAARTAGFEYFETMNVGMLLEQSDPNPRHAIHLVWADEKVRSGDEHPTPAIDAYRQSNDKLAVVSLVDLVTMKLSANRDQDRVHLRDLIGVGLIDRPLWQNLPADLQRLLDPLLAEAGV